MNKWNFMVSQQTDPITTSFLFSLLLHHLLSSDSISVCSSSQQMFNLQQTLLSQPNRQSNQPLPQTGETLGNTNNMNLGMLMNMLGGGLGAGGNLGAAANPNVPPEELYATQLSQLQEMGFFDTQENLRALQVTRGNVNAAVERLLNPGP